MVTARRSPRERIRHGKLPDRRDRRVRMSAGRRRSTGLNVVNRSGLRDGGIGPPPLPPLPSPRRGAHRVWTCGARRQRDLPLAMSAAAQRNRPFRSDECGLAGADLIQYFTDRPAPPRLGFRALGISMGFRTWDTLHSAKHCSCGKIGQKIGRKGRPRRSYILSTLPGLPLDDCSAEPGSTD